MVKCYPDYPSALRSDVFKEWLAAPARRQFWLDFLDAATKEMKPIYSKDGDSAEKSKSKPIAHVPKLVKQTNGCWLWFKSSPSKTNKYPHQQIAKVSIDVHHIGYWAKGLGLKPAGTDTSHLCDNEGLRCCNPDHVIAEAPKANQGRKNCMRWNKEHGLYQWLCTHSGGFCWKYCEEFPNIYSPEEQKNAMAEYNQAVAASKQQIIVQMSEAKPISEPDPIALTINVEPERIVYVEKIVEKIVEVERVVFRDRIVHQDIHSTPSQASATRRIQRKL